MAFLIKQLILHLWRILITSSAVCGVSRGSKTMSVPVLVARLTLLFPLRAVRTVVQLDVLRDGRHSWHSRLACCLRASKAVREGGTKRTYGGKGCLGGAVYEAGLGERTAIKIRNFRPRVVREAKTPREKFARPRNNVYLFLYVEFRGDIFEGGRCPAGIVRTTSEIDSTNFEDCGD